jgi:hypothetical protein
MARQIVHDDNIAGPQFGHENLRHVSLEPIAVDRTPVPSARPSRSCAEPRPAWWSCRAREENPSAIARPWRSGHGYGSCW